MENSTEQACSRVAATDKLLREALAMVDQDILHPIRVSLKEKESLPEFLCLPSGSLIPPCFCFCSARLGALLTCPVRRRRRSRREWPPPLRRPPCRDNFVLWRPLPRRPLRRGREPRFLLGRQSPGPP
jgi:hypothetical protein